MGLSNFIILIGLGLGLGLGLGPIDTFAAARSSAITE